MKPIPKALVCGVAAMLAAAVAGEAMRAKKSRGGVGESAEAVVAVGGGARSVAALSSVILGGFRGVAADLLWLRAGRLQEERRFVELVQLSEWITALEPESPEVWSFHAWNLAYNVTVLLGRPDDRWRWVENAVALLRDSGVAMNPDSPEIKRELAWLFLHKIGTDSDSAAGFYRTSWAREIAGWLEPDGSAPPVLSMQAGELASALKMDAAFMRRLEARFGKIDWRMPEASTLYWGALALEDATTSRERLSCRRMVYSALLSMIRHHGLLKGDAADENWQFGAVPNFALLDAAGEYLEETMREHSFGGVRHAYIGWLHDAILIRLAQGETAAAGILYGKLVSFFAQRGVSDVPPLSSLADAPDGLFTELLDRAGIH